MENYISLNGRKIELSAEQIAEIAEAIGEGKSQNKLSEIPVGDTVKLGKFELVVLEHGIVDAENGTAVILGDSYKDKVIFGDNNNFDGSNADDICQGFAEELAEVVGADNIISHTVNLTSDDGLKDYGTVKRSASLLTADLYRRYVYTLDKYKLDKWWWLATPWSTPTHNDSTYVKCVSPSGDIGNIYCYFGSGVCPFCILKSDIFVSC